MSHLNTILTSLLLITTFSVPTFASNRDLEGGNSNSRKIAAVCNSWKSEGVMEIVQSNGYYTAVSMYGNTGDARGSSYSNPSGSIFTGKPPSTLQLRDVGRAGINISGSGGSVGMYTAYINDDGSLANGITYDAKHPSSQAQWRTDNRLQCRG
jgi:hypothetical protein